MTRDDTLESSRGPVICKRRRGHFLHRNHHLHRSSSASTVYLLLSLPLSSSQSSIHPPSNLFTFINKPIQENKIQQSIKNIIFYIPFYYTLDSNMTYNTRAQARLRNMEANTITVGFPADSKTSAAMTEANDDTGKAADARDADIGLGSRHNTRFTKAMVNLSAEKTNNKKRKRDDNKEQTNSDSTNCDGENDDIEDNNQPPPTNKRRIKLTIDKRHCRTAPAHRYMLRSRGGPETVNAVQLSIKNSSKSGPADPGRRDGTAKP